jgi:hypothetical protein
VEGVEQLGCLMGGFSRSGDAVHAGIPPSSPTKSSFMRPDLHWDQGGKMWDRKI